MQIYEVSNPSDPITMAAEIDAVAACAGLLNVHPADIEVV